MTNKKPQALLSLFILFFLLFSSSSIIADDNLEIAEQNSLSQDDVICGPGEVVTIQIKSLTIDGNETHEKWVDFLEGNAELNVGMFTPYAFLDEANLTFSEASLSKNNSQTYHYPVGLAIKPQHNQEKIEVLVTAFDRDQSTGKFSSIISSLGSAVIGLGLGPLTEGLSWALVPFIEVAVDQGYSELEELIFDNDLIGEHLFILEKENDEWEPGEYAMNFGEEDENGQIVYEVGVTCPANIEVEFINNNAQIIFYSRLYDSSIVPIYSNSLLSDTRYMVQLPYLFGNALNSVTVLMNPGTYHFRYKCPNSPHNNDYYPKGLDFVITDSTTSIAMPSLGGLQPFGPGCEN